MLITGKVALNDLSGPVGIVKAMGDTYDTSQSAGGTGLAILSMVNFSIFLSANLGIMNRGMALNLFNCAFYVFCLRICHGLNQNRMSIANDPVANLYFFCIFSYN